MGENSAIIGIMILIIQIPVWMFASSISLVRNLPLLVLFPLTGLGIILVINGSTPPSFKG
ncbi:MAG: hypothetical protein JW791_01670 [Nanoarchaeota archaeon]|nr:hypothetical protein [Nanoarchaeota archaeon]